MSEARSNPRHVTTNAGDIEIRLIAAADEPPSSRLRKQDVLSRKNWNNIYVAVVLNSASRQPPEILGELIGWAEKNRPALAGC